MLLHICSSSTVFSQRNTRLRLILVIKNILQTLFSMKFILTLQLAIAAAMVAGNLFFIGPNSGQHLMILSAHPGGHKDVATHELLRRQVDLPASEISLILASR